MHVGDSDKDKESMAAISDLHLPDLSVKGFRGIKDLSISRLGRVTLFAGKNGVGKTTLLDATRLYAARGRYPVLVNTLEDREELLSIVDEDGDEVLAPNWEALFHDRHSSPEICISIGPTRENQTLRFRIASLSEEKSIQLRRFSPERLGGGSIPSFQVEFQGMTLEVPLIHVSHPFRRHLLGYDESELPPEIRCESLGPGLLNNAHLARLWDKVALTDDETQAVKALKLIYGDRVQRVTVIGDDSRRVVVKIVGQERPVPLKSLGDGAVRLFGVALALANSQDGFLLIDEVENGIHHSIQPDFWKMVLRTARENNVQVLATTHGWDCVVGFARAATDLDEVEGILVRLEQDGEKIRAIEYSEDDLNIAAEQGIEVR